MACLTGVLAQIRIPLPWSPVPVTGQTLSVLLAGAILGRRWGAISMTIYVVAGFAGLPWFAGASGGWGVLLGPTGGYIVGFVLAALLVGHITDRSAGARRLLPLFGVMVAADFVLIHGPGLLQLGIWTAVVKGTAPEITELLWMGTIPFIPGDLTKAVLAAVLARGVLPPSSPGSPEAPGQS
jgi:biotin transport system substrate-specific component